MLDAIVECTTIEGPRNCEAGFDGRRNPLLPLSSGAPVMPLAAAAMAAMLPTTGVWLMLFRRVTRCAGFRLATDSECECGRFLGSEPAMVLDECRCWLAGRTLIGSWYAGCQRTECGGVLCNWRGTLRTVMLE
jgi:hypothetical protein